MANTRSLLSGQLWFIQYMEALLNTSPQEQLVDQKGVCFGVANMGMLAILADDVNTFNKHLQDIRDIPLNTYPQTIAAAKAIQSILFVQAKDTALQEIYIELKKNTGNKFKGKKLDESMLNQAQKKKLSELIQKHLQLAGNNNTIQDILHTEIFLENVQLFQSAFQYRELFEGTMPSHIDVSKILKMVTPVKLDEQGGVVKAGSFSGIYTLDEITTYLRSIRAMLEHPPVTHPVSLMLHSCNHSITIGYDPAKKSWIFIDANDFPAQYITDESELANKLRSGFSSNNTY